ncbi:MAG: twin-arginine translocase subunit TatC [Paludibacter sp.]|nr:twin-arginine translocase subunit TatC [Paludibacter sp.]
MPVEVDDEKTLSFWEHLEVLRWTIFRILIAISLLVSAIFFFKEFVFTNIVFAPLSSDFWFYRALCSLSELVKIPGICPEEFNIKLINFNLAGQFLVHIGASFSIALVMIIPYILFEIWRFVQPALYPNEKSHVGFVFLSSSFLFYLGVAASYFVIFPLTVRFLGTYEVSALVPNQIAVQSYLGTLYILTFSMGVMFEMPVLAFLLSKIGLINKQMLKKVRSYAFVILLILSALITPTTDPFTMMVVALPLYLLYELSILVCKTKKIEVDEDDD